MRAGKLAAVRRLVSSRRRACAPPRPRRRRGSGTRCRRGGRRRRRFRREAGSASSGSEDSSVKAIFKRKLISRAASMALSRGSRALQQARATAGRGGAAAAYSAPALEKGLDILELLADSAPGLTQNQIAARLGRSAGELFRMLEVLERRGYLGRSPSDGSYSLTLKLFELAHRQPPVKRLLARRAAADARAGAHHPAVESPGGAARAADPGPRPGRQPGGDGLLGAPRRPLPVSRRPRLGAGPHRVPERPSAGSR